MINIYKKCNNSKFDKTNKYHRIKIRIKIIKYNNKYSNNSRQIYNSNRHQLYNNNNNQLYLKIKFFR